MSDARGSDGMGALHSTLGWVAIAAAVVGWIHARGRVRSGRAFESSVYVVVTLLIDVVVLVGAWRWYDLEAWNADSFLRAWAHPSLGLAAVVTIHFGLRRARAEQWAASAYEIIGRMALFAAVLLVASAGVLLVAGA